MERTKGSKLRRTIMRGILSCVLALGAVLTMPVMGMTAKAEDYIIVDGIKYSYDDSNRTARADEIDNSTIGSEIRIRAKIINTSTSVEYRVITIKAAAFTWAEKDKITIEEGIKQIGNMAFHHNRITEIEIPASVNSIGDKVFASCSSLKKISFKGKQPPSVGSNWLGDAGANNSIIIEIPDDADRTEWEKKLYLGSFNITLEGGKSGSSSSSSTTSSSPNQEKNNDGEVEVIEEEPVNRIPEHVCQYEWEVVREVGANQDGLEQYLCKLCGNVQSTLTVPASQYQVQELYTKVTGAAEGETVTYDTGLIHTVCDKLFTKLQQRKDITLVITYQYKGENYRSTFPAGADYIELMQDTDQFYGMLGLNGRCGIVTEKN